MSVQPAVLRRKTPSPVNTSEKCGDSMFEHEASESAHFVGEKLNKKKFFIFELGF